MLKALVNELKEKNQKLYATLSFDEMAIRRNVTWCAGQKKFYGFIDYGRYALDEHLPPASNAIVFMLNGINISFNLPVAHYFITTLDKSEKMFLVLTLIKALTDIDVSIVMVSYDGLPTNISAMELLGASFDLQNMKPYIINPIDQSKIFIMMDPPHMLKLMRNYIGSCKQIKDSAGRSIEWKFYEHLEMLRQSNEFVTHKITRKHIDYEDRKMKVSLATQLLSRSVAFAMQYAMDSGHVHFENAAGTIEFTTRMNNLFDIFNSKNETDSGFKRPLCPANKDHIFAYLDECRDYLEKLEISSGLLIESKKKTGVKGFVIDIITLKMFYEDYIEKGILPSIPVYLFNQDPLESFFGRIRSFPGLGSNDNPTVMQFNSAYRKNVVKNEICASTFANCLDNLNILYIPSTKQNKNTAQSVEIAPVNETQGDDEDPEGDELPDILSECNNFEKCDENVTIAFIAVSIEDKITKILRAECLECATIFDENDKMNIIPMPNHNKIPCKDTFQVCRAAYHQLEIESKKIAFDYPKLLHSIRRGIDFSIIFAGSTHEHRKEKIVDLIIENFIRIRATYIAKKITIELQSNKLMAKKHRHFAGR